MTYRRWDMPLADPTFTWQQALAAFSVVALVAFLVSWVSTDLLGVSRSTYVAILTVTTFVLGAGYLAWSGTSVGDLSTSAIGWGVAAGLVAAVITFPLVRRLPRSPRAHGARAAEVMVWEDLVYGTAEALLLATLPVLAAWQGAVAAGWTGGDAGNVASGVLAIIGAVAVVLVHHLGYEEFRAREARQRLYGALGTCGLQALAFLVTGSVIAPIVAHVVLHAQLSIRGVELPPAHAGVAPT
jgi:hypothetical protein